MTHEFHKLLLSELHMAVYKPGNPELSGDELLCMALTVNENLASLGFTLRPDDIVRLSVSGSLNDFYEHMKSLVPDVKAEPMYPGFPQQVMEISEAEFRMHQMIHYLSTYGIEALTGTQVSKGWLPESAEYVRDRKDTELLENKVVELIPEQDAPYAVLETLLKRRERLTEPELALVLECAPLCTPEQMSGINVRFKENLDILFPLLLGGTDSKTALETLKAVCAHAGDVLRCGQNYLHRNRYHLKTREKKLLVKLLESYPVQNLKENLMLSISARERNLLLLQYMDYNRFSRSAEHREIIRALRNGELISWQGVGEKMLREKDPEALRYFAGRPGYLVRMLNRLLTLGYSVDAILEVLLPAAGRISGHLLMNAANVQKKRGKRLWEKYQEAVDQCEEKYYEETRPPYLNLYSVRAAANAKRDEARKIWLDQPKQDIAAEVFAPLNSLKEGIRQKKRELSAKKKILAQMKVLKCKGHFRLIQNANSSWDRESVEIMLEENADKTLLAEAERIEEEISAMRLQVQELYPVCLQESRRRTEEMKKRNLPAYEAALKKCDEFEDAETRKTKAKYEKDLASFRTALDSLKDKRDKELERLKQAYQEQLGKERHDEQIVQILAKVLKEHFRHAVTPLRDRKVFFDMDQFDLVHSELEAENRSKDGGYIRSGICFRIPQEAKIVRFFVYWDDERRVDVDLHANGISLEGNPLHIGWNGGFRKTGVIFSGDITHSDAAEYIDIDLSAPIRKIDANIHLYSGYNSFRNVDTCFVGLMAVDRAGQDVELYDPRNCFFAHELKQNTEALQYGYIDVQNRYVRFVGQPDRWTRWNNPSEDTEVPVFSLQDYLDCLLEGQHTEAVSSRSEADLVLTMGKSDQENALSLVDHNFFLES